MKKFSSLALVLFCRLLLAKCFLNDLAFSLRKQDSAIQKFCITRINCCCERSHLFTAKKSKVTELDHITKLWGKIFELFSGNAAQYIKSGESASATKVGAKKMNNNSNKDTIGCKVDGRVLFNVCNASVGTCNIEAVKGVSVMNTVYRDKAKLAIESGCIVDHLIINSKNVQICGIEAELCSLAIVDSSLERSSFEKGFLFKTYPSKIAELDKNIVFFFGSVSRRRNHFQGY